METITYKYVDFFKLQKNSVSHHHQVLLRFLRTIHKLVDHLHSKMISALQMYICNPKKMYDFSKSLRNRNVLGK